MLAAIGLLRAGQFGLGLPVSKEANAPPGGLSVDHRGDLLARIGQRLRTGRAEVRTAPSTPRWVAGAETRVRNAPGG